MYFLIFYASKSSVSPELHWSRFRYLNIVFLPIVDYLVSRSSYNLSSPLDHCKEEKRIDKFFLALWVFLKKKLHYEKKWSKDRQFKAHFAMFDEVLVAACLLAKFCKWTRSSQWILHKGWKKFILSQVDLAIDLRWICSYLWIGVSRFSG